MYVTATQTRKKKKFPKNCDVSGIYSCFCLILLPVERFPPLAFLDPNKPIKELKMPVPGGILLTSVITLTQVKISQWRPTKAHRELIPLGMCRLNKFPAFLDPPINWWRTTECKQHKMGVYNLPLYDFFLHPKCRTNTPSCRQCIVHTEMTKGANKFIK